MFAEQTVAMHIPDNYLSPSTDILLMVVAFVVLAVSFRAVLNKSTEDKLTLLAASSAFSFLLMMLNVPLPGGTSGHAVGGTAIAILLGPEYACVGVAISLAIQALFFGDGGILAYGANVFNMAVVLPFVGFGVYKAVMYVFQRLARNEGGVRGAQGVSGVLNGLAQAVGSYVGIVVAAFVASIELGIQPLLFHDAAGGALYNPYPLSVSIPAMVIPHLLVAGVVEAIATVSVVEFVRKAAPGVVRGASGRAGGVKWSWIGVLLGALVAVTPLGLLASATAWGEWSASELAAMPGLNHVPQGISKGFSFSALFPDYSVSGVPTVIGYVLSAVIGIALIGIAVKLVAARVARRSPGAAGAEHGEA